MISPSKLFTIIGGKWTTYRKMGEDMIDKIEKESGWKQTSTNNRLVAHSWIYKRRRVPAIPYIIMEVIKLRQQNNQRDRRRDGSVKN